MNMLLEMKFATAEYKYEWMDGEFFIAMWYSARYFASTILDKDPVFRNEELDLLENCLMGLGYV